MSRQPEEPAPGADLAALRERLRAARAERGACPPWEDVRDDLLPGGAQRAGRTERLAHLELCPYCDAHVREWKRSVDRTSDTLEALEKGVARGVVTGAKKIAGLAVRPLTASERQAPAPASAPVTALASPPAPVPRAAPPTYVVAPPPRPMPVAPAPARPPTPHAPAIPPAAAAPRATPLRLLVVECPDESTVPASVFLCAAAIEAEVACVDRIEDLGGDPDLDAICGVIFAGNRPPAEWPEAVRRAKDLAPGRPIVVLAPAHDEMPTGARRPPGARLLLVTDSAERLLVALED